MHTSDSSLQPQAPSLSQALLCAVDFGLSITDVLIVGENENILQARHSSLPALGRISNADLLEVLTKTLGPNLPYLKKVVVTGGHSALLEEELVINPEKTIPIEKANELTCIGSAIHQWMQWEQNGDKAGDKNENGAQQHPILAVSCGTGTAMVLINNGTAQHVGGTGIGGGTLIALASLCLRDYNMSELIELCEQGNAAALDLSLGEATSSDIGNLPPEAVAVNLGALRHGINAENNPSNDSDIAAALANFIGQEIGLLAGHKCKLAGCETVHILGRTATITPFLRQLKFILKTMNIETVTNKHFEYGTAFGALAQVQGQNTSVNQPLPNPS